MKQDIWAATRPALPDLVDNVSAERSPLLDVKVLMIDDDPLMTDLIQAHLEEACYANVVVSNDPATALALVRRERPGLLLLDLMMPGVSGFDILEAIRADAELRYTPVIVLTAATTAPARLHALQLGATDFLAKPVDESELVLRVRNTLAFRHYHERLIHFDQVTDLPTERRFELELDDLLRNLPPDHGLTAFISIAVPECRTLRESVGRATADALAVAIARRLEGLAEPSAMALERLGIESPRAARLDEQHFALVLTGLPHADAVERAAKSIVATLSKAVRVDAHEVVPTPWLGIALAPSDGASAAVLRQCADLAASHGLRQATVHYTFASAELNERSYRRVALAAQLRMAVARSELRLHYQPKMDITGQRIVGVEALVRWQHPERGLLGPAEFVPLAEELGLICDIGRWVVERACMDAAVWARAGRGELKVSINVAKPQFASGDLDNIVWRALKLNGLPAHQLVLELTESMLMDDVAGALDMMQRLKALGVALSIDDFGTGYSSLAYLKRFPVDELKIDRSFVIDLPGQPVDQALVHAIVNLGHSLNMTVVAEGVETAEQFDCLRRLGCDSMQGYLFHKPMALDQLAERWTKTSSSLVDVL